MTNDDIARTILDADVDVVLATADGDGVPWASPVWFAKEDYRELYWVSYPGARHSRNIAVRPQIAMVVFDSTVPPGTGRGCT
jgi:nitroimidazol reductase NimA-like FMN-containing flavoprotein (pyridoxamine 5'-phosphate oxidase superfamily)